MTPEFAAPPSTSSSHPAHSLPPRPIPVLVAAPVRVHVHIRLEQLVWQEPARRPRDAWCRSVSVEAHAWEGAGAGASVGARVRSFAGPKDVLRSTERRRALRGLAYTAPDVALPGSWMWAKEAHTNISYLTHPPLAPLYLLLGNCGGRGPASQLLPDKFLPMVPVLTLPPRGGFSGSSELAVVGGCAWVERSDTTCGDFADHVSRASAALPQRATVGQPVGNQELTVTVAVRF
ncbi:hypothetical protein DFH07DRAFT_764660 [Mycena maculata]|uniref:Uncharacterized protein n=1 Tax=Mycena maculata TaxID=230809 RepID=A0AAD7KDS1_9AGAR|nr:hypothetical protein DFH07DRAFT_764660 [Mycena maculata]